MILDNSEGNGCWDYNKELFPNQPTGERVGGTVKLYAKMANDA